MGDEMLTGVCELAFDVAKEGGAPSVMKNYLYLAQRPPRAYSVAQRALEEDPSFRSRVAQRATIANVGEAGYLWLHRPEGWEMRFAALESGTAPIAVEGVPVTPLAERPPMPAPPTPDVVVPEPTSPMPPVPQPPEPTASPVSPPPPPVAPDVRSVAPAAAGASGAPRADVGGRDQIEDELADLRSLVDRLADERKNVRSSVSELEVELEQRRAENEQMSSQLSTLRRELDTVQSAEATVLLERDRSIARVTELEAEVASLRTEVERLAAAAEGSAAEHEAALTDLATLGGERDQLRAELEQLRATHEQIQADLAATRAQRDRLAEIEADRDRLQGELDAVVTDRNSLSGQFNQIRTERDALVTERDALQGQFDATQTERDSLRSERDGLAAEHEAAAERLVELDQLRADNTELAQRLAVAEKARVDLEGQLEEVSLKWQSATRQLTVFEGVSRQLDDAVAERKTMESQLRLANGALAELHRRIGSSHDQIRTELTSIESAFGEAPVDEAPADDTPGDEGAPTVESAPQAMAAADVDEAAPITDSSAAPGEPADAPASDMQQIDDYAVVDDSDAPAFGDSIGDAFAEALDGDGSETTERVAADLDDALDDAEASSDGDEPFDPTGLELDPDALGGRTIGDMFGADSDDDREAPNDELESSAVDGPPAAPAERGTRRRITVPADLDQTASARHIAATPDVILLVDGDGVAGLGWPHLEASARRAALVGYMRKLAEETGAAADVVFERSIGGEEALQVSRAVRVRIADEAIAESSLFETYIGGYPDDWPIAMVTNEPNLTVRAEELQVSLLSNDQLLDLFLDLRPES